MSKDIEEKNHHDLFLEIVSRLISPTSWSQSAINSSDFYSEYKFASNNPFLEHSKPFEEGLQRLAVHDIVNAALFFEAAVKQNSDHIDVILLDPIDSAHISL